MLRIRIPRTEDTQLQQVRSQEQEQAVTGPRDAGDCHRTSEPQVTQQVRIPQVPASYHGGFLVNDEWKQTIEAYYEARLEEMQAQYDRLLADVEGAKQAAKAEVYRTFDDNSAVVPDDGAPKSPA